MKFIVLGAAGRMGSLHAKHLMKMGHDVIEIDPKLPPMLDNKFPGHWLSIKADGIVIATPAEYHHSDLVTAVNAGLNVFIEKPICIIGREYVVRAALALAKEKGLVVSVGYNLRFHPAVEGIKSAISAGGVSPLWGSFLLRQRPKRPIGRFLEEWASHEVDLAMHLMGDAIQGTRALGGFDNRLELILEHTNQGVSFIWADALTEEPYRRTFTIIDVDGRYYHRNIEFDRVQDSHYFKELAEWVELVQHAGKPVQSDNLRLATGEEGLAVIELLRKVSGQ